MKRHPQAWTRLSLGSISDLSPRWNPPPPCDSIDEKIFCQRLYGDSCCYRYFWYIGIKRVLQAEQERITPRDLSEILCQNYRDVQKYDQ